MRNFIVDTDIGPDCDDAAAVAMLNLFADQGLCRILGFAHCTSNPYGAGTIDAINRYYGRGQIPISTYYGEGFLTEECHMKYNRYITTHLPNRYRDGRPEEAVGMYRRILAVQEDRSVECIAIGPLNNLSALLHSGPDAVSPLCGKDLVQRKVSGLTLMAGAFPSPLEGTARRALEDGGCGIQDVREFNVVCDLLASRDVARNWPTPKTYVGWEAGLFKTGKYLRSAVPETHPVRLAYQLYTEDGERYSWDLLTVAYAAQPDSPYFWKSQPGKVLFSDRGETLWTPLEGGTDRFIELAWPEDDAIEAINRLLVRAPAGGFPESGETG